LQKRKGNTVKSQAILIFITGLVAVALIMTEGCVVAAVGAGAAGTVAYIKGDLEAVEGAGIDEVYAATEAAADELELFIISKKKDKLSAGITARDAEDKKVDISLAATADGSTKISIRVGTFGNETKSRLIYDKIKEHL
jgi:hypothetical protein